MPQNLAELRQRLSEVKPWAGVAAILAVVLLGYFLFQGWRYLQASAEIAPLTREIQGLDNSILLMVRAAKASEAKLREQALDGQRSEAELRDLFRRQSPEDLMAIVADTALATAVNLTSMSPEFPETQIRGELQYEVESLSVAVEGATTDLNRFLTSLHENLPVVSVSEIRIDNLDDAPATQVQLVFYLSPSTIEETEQEEGG
jgi:Tfp pilus assembly protein PilN